MKIKKIYFKIIIIILISFIIGNISSYIFKINPLFTKIKICNNTDIDISTIIMNYNINFSRIPKKSCTDYKSVGIINKRPIIEVLTYEDDKLYRYSRFPIDFFPRKKYLFGKNELHINNLRKDSRYIRTEFFYSIQSKFK